MFPLSSIKHRILRRAETELSQSAADFIVIALFQYISTLRLKFHTPGYEFLTSLTEMRIIKRESQSERDCS